jgi:hypothetical protein
MNPGGPVIMLVPAGQCLAGTSFFYRVRDLASDMPRLASASARSFPALPACPLTQSQLT